MEGESTTSASAEQYDMRKQSSNHWLRYERSPSAQDDMSVMMYAGERETTQYQSIPMAPQLNLSHAGGVITPATPL
ncbi:hypothetical protein DMI62_20285, partial [Escherichia coli]|nr:hypothetical protein [Escherichia coli]